jgi:hypothetical protein
MRRHSPSSFAISKVCYAAKQDPPVQHRSHDRSFLPQSFYAPVKATLHRLG